jgi:hypothetical protein
VPLSTTDNSSWPRSRKDEPWAGDVKYPSQVEHPKGKVASDGAQKKNIMSQGSPTGGRC